MSRKITIFNSIFTVYIFSVLNFIFSILLQLFLAFLFGTSFEMDAYVVAISLPMIISNLVISFEVVFVPAFKNYSLKTNRGRLSNIVSTVFNLFILLLVLISVLCFVLAPRFISMLAPGLSLESKELAQLLLRIMAPSMIFSGLAAFLTSVYHFQEKFTLPAMVSVVSIVIMIITTFLLNARIGIQSLAWGVLLGSIIQFFILLPGAMRNKHYSLVIDIKHPELIWICRRLLWLGVGGVFLSSILILEKFLASKLPEGSISALNYAGKTISLIAILPSAAISTVLLPQLSTFYTLKDINKLRDLLSKGLRISFLLVFPTVALLFVFRSHLIKLLFERGAFDVSAVNNTSIALVCYLGIFIATGIGRLITIGFLAMQDVIMPSITMTGAFLVYACIAPLLSRLFSFKGLASAFSLVCMMGMFMLIYILRKRLCGIDGKNLLYSSLKIICSSWAMGLAALFVFKNLPVFFYKGQNFTLALRLGIATICGFIIFNLVCFALRVEELRLVYETINLKLRKVLEKS